MNTKTNNSTADNLATQSDQAKQNCIPQGHPLVEDDWTTAMETIPVDLDETAKKFKALQRRRKVKNAADSLRLVLAYCICDWPLILVALWACLQGIATLSDVGVMKRLKKAKGWLGHLIVEMLNARRIQLKAAHPVRVRIVDGSSFSQPGSKGTDYRFHLSLDLGSQRIDGVSVTDTHSGETLTRHTSQPGDIWVGDRAYGSLKGIRHVLSEKGEAVMRIRWSGFPLKDADGSCFDLFRWLRQLATSSVREIEVQTGTKKENITLRLIAYRLPQEQAEKARRRLRKIAKDKCRPLSKKSLEVAGYTLLVTTLSAEQWTAQDILDLYRLRWQVELVFKRLKSILDADQLRAKGPELAQTYLLGKVLAALMIDVMTDQAAKHCPDFFASTEAPLNLWQWTRFCLHIIRSAICGSLSWQQFLARLPQLTRYFKTRHRRDRVYQVAAARKFLKRLLGKEAVAVPKLS